MSEQFDTLHISAEKLHTLADNKHISADALEYALRHGDMRPDRAAWIDAVRLVLLVVGLGLMVAGVFHFFSWNWEALTREIQLMLVLGLVVGATGFAVWRGIGTLSGKIAMSAAAALVGAVLIVHMINWEVPWEDWLVPAIWAAVALAWVAVARFAPLWLAWLLLLCFSISIIWDESVGRDHSVLYVILALVGLLALVYWERRYKRGEPDFSERWWPRVVATLSLVILLFPSLGYVASDFDSWRDDYGALALVIYALLTLVFLWYYRRRVRDLLPLTAAVLGLVMMSVAVIGQLTEFDNAGWLLLTGVLVVAETALAVRWLQSVSRRWEAAGGAA